MTETRRDRAATLLLRALDSLGPEERELVLHELLTGSVASRPASRPRHPQPAVTEAFHLQHGVEMSKQLGQPLLVRLPADLHARFRRWSTDNGFSMAAVVRGLLERFLDDQAARG